LSSDTVFNYRLTLLYVCYMTYCTSTCKIGTVANGRPTIPHIMEYNIASTPVQYIQVHVPEASRAYIYHSSVLSYTYKYKCLFSSPLVKQNLKVFIFIRKCSTSTRSDAVTIIHRIQVPFALRPIIFIGMANWFSVILIRRSPLFT
jgi:hypothetical protein